MTKVYKKGVPAISMSIDGWSRGFDTQQTLAQLSLDSWFEELNSKEEENGS